MATPNFTLHEVWIKNEGHFRKIVLVSDRNCICVNIILSDCFSNHQNVSQTYSEDETTIPLIPLSWRPSQLFGDTSIASREPWSVVIGTNGGDFKTKTDHGFLRKMAIWRQNRGLRKPENGK